MPALRPASDPPEGAVRRGSSSCSKVPSKRAFFSSGPGPGPGPGTLLSFRGQQRPKGGAHARVPAGHLGARAPSIACTDTSARSAAPAPRRLSHRAGVERRESRSAGGVGQTGVLACLLRFGTLLGLVPREGRPRTTGRRGGAAPTPSLSATGEQETVTNSRVGGWSGVGGFLTRRVFQDGRGSLSRHQPRTPPRVRLHGPRSWQQDPHHHQRLRLVRERPWSESSARSCCGNRRARKHSSVTLCRWKDGAEAHFQLPSLVLAVRIPDWC